MSNPNNPASYADVPTTKQYLIDGHTAMCAYEETGKTVYILDAIACFLGSIAQDAQTKK